MNEEDEPLALHVPGAVIRNLPSLRFNGDTPRLSFVHPEYLFLVLVAKTNIEAFDYAGKKILDVRLDVKWKESPAPVSEENRLAYVHIGSSTDGKPFVPELLSAAFVADKNEIVAGHNDGFLRFYTIRRGRMGHLTRRFQTPFVPVAMESIGAEYLLIVGADGALRRFGVESLEFSSREIRPNFVPKEGNRATCISIAHRGIDDTTRICVGYGNGGVVVCSLEDFTKDGQMAVQFVAHAGPVTGIASMFKADFVVTGGEDRVLAIFDTATGRCLARQDMGFSIAAVHTARSDPNDTGFGGETAAIVAGSRESILICKFRVVNPWSASIEVVSKLSESMSWMGSRALTSVSYCALDGVLVATFTDGVAQRWVLSASEARLLARSADEEECFTGALRENIKVLDIPRLGSKEPVLRAQELLQELMAPEAGLSEPLKDKLVSEFQSQQESYQAKLEASAAELATEWGEIIDRLAEDPGAEYSERVDRGAMGSFCRAYRLGLEEDACASYFSQVEQAQRIAQQLHRHLVEILIAATKKAEGHRLVITDIKEKLARMRKAFGA